MRHLLHWPCDEPLPSRKKHQAQACEGRAGGESSLGAAAAPGGWTLVRWIYRRAAAARAAGRCRAFTASPVGAGTALPRETGRKKQKRVDLRSTLRAFLRFPGRDGCHLASARRPRGKQPRPKTSVAGTAMQDSGHDRAQRGQNPGITQNRA